jgi:hypothetical protein
MKTELLLVVPIAWERNAAKNLQRALAVTLVRTWFASRETSSFQVLKIMKRFICFGAMILLIGFIAQCLYPTWLGNRKMSSILNGDSKVRVAKVRIFDGFDELKLEMDELELKMFEDGLRRSEYKGYDYGLRRIQIIIHFIGGGVYEFADASFDDGVLSVKDYYAESGEPLWASHWVKFDPRLSLRIEQAFKD